MFQSTLRSQEKKKAEKPTVLKKNQAFKSYDNVADPAQTDSRLWIGISGICTLDDSS